MNKDVLLEVKNLKKYFPITGGFFNKVEGYVKAVDDLSFEIIKGEVFGLVGESGCGKSTTARSILRALDPTSGEVNFYNSETEEVYNLASMNKAQLRGVRQYIQTVFQDPYSSLNPRMTIKEIVSEPVLINKLAPKNEFDEIVADRLERVGLKANYMSRYPHAFSGGQRQRVAIARALSIDPQFLVCDEIVSALDVSVQAQILNLLEELKQEFELTLLFIAHDLSVIKHICDRVAVMYVGKIVEIAKTEDLFAHPAHPYTESLLAAVPKTDPESGREILSLEGEVPDPSNPPSGCYFHTRCKYSEEICKKEFPELKEVKGNKVACHFAEELDLDGIAEI
jgi:peptide/nickel transport system ATP-binding protein